MIPDVLIAISVPGARKEREAVLTRTSTTLLEGIRDDSNHAAWEEFDSRYRPLLLAVGRRLNLHVADCEDAAQDALTAFIEGYRRGSYHRQQGRLRDWLTGIMAHKVRDLQRRQLRSERVVADAAAHMADDVDAAVATVMGEEWARAMLRQCLEEIRRDISTQMYQSFELSALQLWPARQVSQRLGITVDAVYQNKTRVLTRLRELLPKMEEAW